MKPIPRSNLLTVALWCALCLLLIAPPAGATPNAQPPGNLTYQGFLTDTSGVPLGNTAPVNRTVLFKIYDTPTGGVLKWSESQVVTIDRGHFSALLGEGSHLTGPLAVADVFAGPTASDRYMEITVDSNGTPLTPRMQFLPAPYALLARSANQLVGPDGAAVLTAATGSLTLVGSVTSTAGFSGNGSLLTALNGANITTGTVGSTQITDGSIVNADIAVGAAIADTKLATISTAGKVSNSATTATAANTPNAIMARDAAGSVAATSFAGNGTIPIGGIIMWSGALTAVPAGWALCDGLVHSGVPTPNLRDRFIVGAGTTYAVGTTGGSSSATLAVANLPSFTINKTVQTTGYTSSYGSGQEVITAPNRNHSQGDQTFVISFTGQNTPVDIRPLYYSLAFIMRVL